jgi:hypothetical protein
MLSTSGTGFVLVGMPRLVGSVLVLVLVVEVGCTSVDRLPLNGSEYD